MVGNRVDQCVEIMCQKGCKTLWADIEALQNGIALPEVELLSVSEREQVLSLSSRQLWLCMKAPAVVASNNIPRI